MVRNVIVGCGISGAVTARILADQFGENSLVIDARPHTGGNCYDFYDQNQICIHKYGAHIFHTDSQAVWEYLSRFTQWHPYMHKVVGLVDGQYVPIPFNLNSIHMAFPDFLARRVEEKLVTRFGLGAKVSIGELRESEEKDLVFLASYVHKKVFLGYTQKQWGVTPDKIDPTVLARVPVHVSRDDRYFQNRWQGIPRHGYSAMIEAILDHPRITVKTDTAWNDVKEEFRRGGARIFYTGPVDELLDWRFGELPYRSVTQDFREYDREFFQTSAVVNYPENHDFTRISEYKHFLADQSPRTVVSFEYPSAWKRGENEPAYPVAGKENDALHQRYVEAAQGEYGDIYFLGRLGDYRYYDMDKAVARVFSVMEGL